MNVTTCPKCSATYEESSEEAANDPGRCCAHCHRNAVLAEQLNQQEIQPLRRSTAYLATRPFPAKGLYCTRPNKVEIDEHITATMAGVIHLRPTAREWAKPDATVMQTHEAHAHWDHQARKWLPGKQCHCSVSQADCPTHGEQATHRRGEQ